MATKLGGGQKLACSGVKDPKKDPTEVNSPIPMRHLLKAYPFKPGHFRNEVHFLRSGLRAAARLRPISIMP